MVVRTACGLAVFRYEEVLIATFAIYFICPNFKAVEKCQYIIMIEGWNLNILTSVEYTNSWKAYRSISEGEEYSYTSTAIEILNLIT